MGRFVTNFLRGNQFKGDKTVWMIYFFLCMISLVEVYSASSSLTYKSGNHWDPMVKQAMCLGGGFVVLFLVHKIPCRVFMVAAPVLLLISVLSLLYALAFGGTINEANRWIDLGLFSFQPSEFAKMALIMCVAVVLAKTQAETKTVKNGKLKIESGAIKGGRNLAFKIIVWMMVIVCGLIAPENLSTALMLGAVVVTMMFIGRIPSALMLKGLLVLFASGAVFAVTLVSTPNDVLDNVPMGKRMTTWKQRILDKFTDGESKDSISYVFENAQVAHANIAVANSNVVGVGPGNSVERDFLSHAESDFIFSIVVEELGIFGAIFVIFLYLTLLIRVGRIAQKCQRFFPAYLVIGIGIMLVLQAMVNMGVAVGLFPVTGQPLPFISKGGSSILASSIYIGVILSVSHYAEKVNEPKQELVEGEDTDETNECANQAGLD